MAQSKLSFSLKLSQPLYLSFSPFIFFPPSRCFQLQETHVSSCLTSRLNVFALLCFFLEWQPLSRGTSAMTNTHRFKVTLFPSNRSLYYAPPRSLCTLVKVIAPICKDCFWAWQGHMSGGGGVIAGFQCPSRRWWCWTMEQPVILKRRKISPLPLTTPFSFDALFYSSLSSLQKDIFQISS